MPNTTVKHIVAFSGGKDSTAMALRLRELHPENEFEYLITPTGDELPDMVEHWKKMEDLLGQKMIVLPNQSLPQLIDEFNSLPNWRMRWCTRIIKIEPMIEYMESLEPGSIMYVGLRADEESRLGLRYPEAQFETCYPMKDWGWRLQEVLAYLKVRDVTIPRRTDCARCFFQSLEDWRQLHLQHPDIYEDAVQDEAKTGHTYRSPNKNPNWPHRLEDLRAEFESGRKPRIARRGAGRCRFCSM